MAGDSYGDKSSRAAGFHRRSPQERIELVGRWASLSKAEVEALESGSGLDLAAADRLVENVVGVHGLPLAVAVNFVVNGRDVLVPMAVEEPSVVAGASAAAKLAREGGGFQAEAAAPEAEEQTEFTVVLQEIGANKINVIKAVRELTSLGLKESKDLVEGAPQNVREGIGKEEAATAKQKLEAAGATVVVK